MPYMMISSSSSPATADRIETRTVRRSGESWTSSMSARGEFLGESGDDLDVLPLQ